MKVNLAEYVSLSVFFTNIILSVLLSDSVSAAFEMMGDKVEYEETAKFCLMFDKFFDCLNTRKVKE